MQGDTKDGCMQIRAASLTNYRKVAEASGLNVERVLEKAEVPLHVLTMPDAQIPANSVIRLLEMSAELSGNGAFGLEMSEGRSLSNIGPISLLIQNQKNLRQIFFGMLGGIRRTNDAIFISVKEDRDEAIIDFDVIADSESQKRQAVELFSGAIVGVIRNFLGARWKPRSVGFIHGGAGNLSVHRRILGENCRFFCRKNSIHFASSDLDKTNPAWDEGMAQYAHELLKSSGLIPVSDSPFRFSEIKNIAVLGCQQGGER